MGINIGVQFENESRIFYPGSIIKGKVRLENSEDITVKGFTLTFFGDAEVYWTESEMRHDTVPSHHRRSSTTPRRHVHREYRNQENFLCDEIIIFGQGEEEGGDTFHLTAGIREYPFTYLLPQTNLPSSFTDSPFGFIKYTLEARLKRPMFRYARVEEEFCVKGIVDLNFIPSVLQPCGVNKRTNIGWLCCSDGYVAGDLMLEKMGFLPGEALPFSVAVLNTSNVKISSIETIFSQTVEFITFDRKKTSYKEISILFCTARVDTSTLTEWNDRFLIPRDLPPTTLSGCRIVRINYKIDLLVKFSGNKMKITAPIFIGTEPSPVYLDSHTNYSVQNSRQGQNNEEPLSLASCRETGTAENFRENDRLQGQSESKLLAKQKEYNPALNPFLNCESKDDSDGDELTNNSNAGNNNEGKDHDYDGEIDKNDDFKASAQAAAETAETVSEEKD